MRHVLAVDLGTSVLKVALASTDGTIVAAEQEPCSVSLLPGGGAEQDPEDWWSLIAKTAARLLGGAAVPRESVAAVCCTTQWSGTVATGPDGRALRPAIIWMDSRGARQARQVCSGPIRIQGYSVDKLARWVRKTGGAPARSGKDPIAHILWLKENEPDTYARTRYFLEPKDWINARLTGRAAATYDSIALHWVTDNRDPTNIRYDPDLLRLAGIRRAQLPDLVAATDVLGPLLPGPAAELGLPAGIPVVAGTPDLQSAAIGAGATRDFQAHLYIGTSAWLSCHVPYKRTDLRRNLASLPAAIPGRYLVADEQETAGAALTFLRDRMQLADSYAQLDLLAAASPPGSNGVIFTPWLNGERTPVEDSSLRAGLHNLSLSTSLNDVARAVLEGVALNSRWLLRAVERFTRHRLDPIRFIGGGARSDVWCQILADVLGRTIAQVADPVNANARGAAIIAAVALGEMGFDQAPELTPVARHYAPNPRVSVVYDELFGEFVGIYRHNHRSYARLNRTSR